MLEVADERDRLTLQGEPPQHIERTHHVLHSTRRAGGFARTYATVTTLWAQVLPVAARTDVTTGHRGVGTMRSQPPLL
jgi:hypothetical protein